MKFRHPHRTIASHVIVPHKAIGKMEESWKKGVKSSESKYGKFKFGRR